MSDSTTVKRSSSDSPPQTPPPSSKKAKTPTSSTKKSTDTGNRGLTKEAKKVVVERAMEVAAKHLPWSELAVEVCPTVSFASDFDQLGIAESRLKDQFKPSRANLRKSVVDQFS